MRTFALMNYQLGLKALNISKPKNCICTLKKNVNASKTEKPTPMTTKLALQSNVINCNPM